MPRLSATCALQAHHRAALDVYETLSRVDPSAMTAAHAQRFHETLGATLQRHRAYLDGTRARHQEREAGVRERMIKVKTKEQGYVEAKKLKRQAMLAQRATQSTLLASIAKTRMTQGQVDEAHVAMTTEVPSGLCETLSLMTMFVHVCVARKIGCVQGLL